MSVINDFLGFALGGGANVESQASYSADSDRTNGNQPGIARSSFVNKAVRQANYITSQVAQYIADKSNTDVLDDTISAKLLAQINAAMLPITPVVTRYTSGSGTHNLTYQFFIASGNATVGATYTNNAFTFTVVTTVASGVRLVCTGTGAPSSSGTLTKASGTGDATITFYAVRAPQYAIVEMVGGGGGGGGGGAGATQGGDGGDTTFGASLTAGKGTKGGVTAVNPGGAGGSNTASVGTVLINVPGSTGGPSVNSIISASVAVGGYGGNSFYAGGGYSGPEASNGGAGQTNSGSGGGGGGVNSGASSKSGGGGGAGGFLRVLLSTLSATYAYAVGAGGTAGGAGASAGGAGAAGVIAVTECYQ